MDIKEFHNDLVATTLSGSQTEINSPHLEFFNNAIEQLVDSEELNEDAQYNIDHYEGVGYRNARMVFDSYCYDPVDKSFTMIINDFSNESELTTLTNSDIDRLYGQMLHFMEAAIDGYITDDENHYEPSTAGYIAATDIRSKFLNGEILKFRFHIVTDRILSTRVKILKKEPIEGKPVDLNIWDLNRFYNLYISSLGKEEIDVDTTTEFGGGISCVKATEYESYTSYLAYVSGKFLADIYLQFGARLLEGNVRSFLSIRGKINKGIRYTILNNPEMFFTYNNGIAVTATDIDTKRDEDGNLRISRIKNMQIINGGQTTASVANVLIQDKAEENLKNLFIPVKLTVIHDAEKTDEMVQNISRYANSQNKIDEADFFSNNPYHVKLEELSRKILAPPKGENAYQTVWFYERARGQYGQAQMKLSRSDRKKFQAKNPKNQLLKKTDVAKYVNTFKCKPHLVSRGAQTNMRFFAVDINKMEERDTQLAWVNERYFKSMIAYAIMFKSTEKIVSAQPWYNDYRANIVTYSLAIIQNEIEKNFPEKTLNLIRIWGKQELYKELKDQIVKTTKEVNDYITSEDRPVQNVTEWCKKEECWNRAKNMKFELLPKFVGTLILKEYAQEEERAAIKESRENNEINDQITVAKQGPEFWQDFLDYCEKERLTSYIEGGCIKVAARTHLTMRYPSEKQCKTIMNAYRRLEKDGSLPDELKIVIK